MSDTVDERAVAADIRARVEAKLFEMRDLLNEAHSKGFLVNFQIGMPNGPLQAQILFLQIGKVF